MATPLSLPSAPNDVWVERLVDALESDFLGLLSWDWDLRVVTYPRSHPVLGMPDCRVVGCDKGVKAGSPMCPGCANRWKTSDLSLEDFVATVRAGGWRTLGQLPCRVIDCERPRKTVRSGLCSTHHFQQTKTLKLDLEEFLSDPSVQPLSGFGNCIVAACYRQRGGPKHPYCDPHRSRLAVARRLGTFDGDEEAWRLTTSAVAASRQISLRGLPDRLVVELLFGLQVRAMNGVKTYDHHLRAICDRLRAVGAATITSLTDDALAEAGLSPYARTVLRGTQTALRRLVSTPETERLKDIWDLVVFGHSGTLNFTKICQKPLREALKIWAYNDLPRRRGKSVRAAMQGVISAMVLLSESLRLQRDDGGQVLALLSRKDITNFCNRVAFLAENGKMSAHRRVNTIRFVRQVLNRTRSLGLTRPGEVLGGLPNDFALSLEDIPDEPEDTEAGKDLPDAVMRQLSDNLHLLEKATNREYRIAVELMMDTGRRPDEIYQLPWDCLRKDPDGSLVLLYDNSKAFRLGRKLPIGKATAAMITEQQERARQRFPETPTADLRLLPSPVANPHGTKSISTFSESHRLWVDSLPDFLIPVVVEVEGQPVTKLLPFDKSKIFPYAYRHSYAQRHADANIAPDVLKDLMDHRQLSTTQSYYRVSQERRREAVDRVVALQFDRHGNRVWRKAQGLLQSEHVRREIGEVATAYGVCKEPSNVAAGGQSCPLRFRCVGCDHFNTDVSYLPDLEAYLADLLRSREKLRSAFEADDWARSEASPSDEEIRRVRRLIKRVKADLDDLSAEDRAQIEQAIAVVRRTRTVMLGMPRVGQPLPDTRPWRSA
ncbi:site-specific integrase [Streptomyces sp. NPDC088106]|uniref:site-specific integrase n=1 Tax=Streptomyces sp. NPDC088106 TaxID=3154867 RepID=UPI003441A840